MSGKCADSETQLEVDEFILDYLVYMATAALLDHTRHRRQRPVPVAEDRREYLSLQMVDGRLCTATA